MAFDEFVGILQAFELSKAYEAKGKMKKVGVLTRDIAEREGLFNVKSLIGLFHSIWEVMLHFLNANKLRNFDASSKGDKFFIKTRTNSNTHRFLGVKLRKLPVCHSSCVGTPLKTVHFRVFQNLLHIAAMFPIALHLSSGTRIALAPAVLAHLYAELTLLKNHITSFNESPHAHLSALFKLVQVWTWEKFRELQPKPNKLLQGQPRFGLWDDLKQLTSDVKQILENSKMDSFDWRPYTRTVTNWKFLKFYPEKAMFVTVCPSLDEEFISFA
ncbi:unnamed protein product [Arabidopsis halleri]